MSRKRVKAGAISLITASILLTACGSVTVENASNAPAQTVLRTVTMFGGSDPGAMVYEELLREFARENPDIRIEDESRTSDEQWKMSVAADFAAGNEPDVLQFFTDATANQLIAMDKFVTIEEIREEYPEYAGDTWDWALEQVANGDGVMRAVPTTGVWEGLYVNEDLFEQYDIPLPTDWDSFLYAVEAFREKNVIPVACSLSNVPHYWLEYLLLYTAGEESYLSVGKTGREDWIKAVETFAVLRQMGAFPDDTDSITNEYAQELFAEKQAAMLLEGSWYLPAVQDTEHTIVLPFPGVPEQKTESGTVIGGMTSGFYITRRAWNDPNKRDAAVRYVMAQTSSEAVQRYYENGGGTAVAATPVTSPENRSRLEVCAAAYASGNTEKLLSTDSRMDPEAYKVLIAGIPEVSLGGSGKVLLEQVFSVASEKE